MKKAFIILFAWFTIAMIAESCPTAVFMDLATVS